MAGRKAGSSSRRRKVHRYFLEDDEIGLTPSSLKRLGRRRQAEYLVFWFKGRFEDPAEETPWNSQEGGYQYIYGGPYDARDELDSEFGSIVEQDVIDAVVERVERSGTVDWAPGHLHPDHAQAVDESFSDDDERAETDLLDLAIAHLERGSPPAYGSTEDQQLRRQIVEEVQQLKQLLAPPMRGGIGHNNPPSEDEGLAPIQASEASQAAEVIETELAKPEPDALEVGRAARCIKAVLGWFARKADLAADSFIKGAASTAGKTVGTTGVGAVIYHALGGTTPDLKATMVQIVAQVTEWLLHVAMPF